MINPNEPEAKECTECFSSMTEQSIGRYNILKCDNTECAHTIELKGEDDE